MFEGDYWNTNSKKLQNKNYHVRLGFGCLGSEKLFYWRKQLVSADAVGNWPCVGYPVYPERSAVRSSLLGCLLMCGFRKQSWIL